MLLAFLLAAAIAQEAPVARWNFDGDGAPGGNIKGRVSFVDSPIGPSGQMLVLNGVDAYVQVDPTGKLGAGSGDFTICLWICPLEMRDAVLLSRSGAWSVEMGRDGRVRFQATTGDRLETEPRLLSAHQWFHVAVAIGRTGAGKESAIAVNGETRARGTIRAADLDPAGAALLFGRGADEKSLTCGLLDDVRLYKASLSSREIDGVCDEGMSWVRPRAKERTGFQGGFSLEAYDVVVFAGGEDVVAQQGAGHLEARLSASAGPSRVRFRSMAWEGDTVYEQPRLLNFGTWRDQLSRVGAGVVFAQFGAMEALEGKPGLERFGAAYERLLGEFSKATPRIVVVSPVPYEKPAAPLPDLSKRNEDLRLYVGAMKDLALRRKLVYVDLFGARWGERLTRDGIHLSEPGQAAVAREIARQLGVRMTEPTEELLGAVRKKNRAWLEYWRPSNWAFLNGDRIEQPSSRDHLDRRIRWFPVEVQQMLAVVRREEEGIQKLLENSK
jgi:hypothetical protein